MNRLRDRFCDNGFNVPNPCRYIIKLELSNRFLIELYSLPSPLKRGKSPGKRLVPLRDNIGNAFAQLYDCRRGSCEEYSKATETVAFNNGIPCFDISPNSEYHF